MQALLEIASPANQLTSLQLFYDTMENRLENHTKAMGISLSQLSWDNYPMS